MPKSKTEQKNSRQTGVRLDSEKLHRLKIVALNQRRTLTDVLEDAISDYLKKYDKREG